ncbi:hypothetical protein, conserved [Eimeria maxima]|uniref:Uncharacterized protein n=1 Tax=Eimeria maxima TaxID=5804 RepID=U6M4K4_EIMMA|nr:hypothetical protein, conserved [Eimeria maxima]CDJ56590.1 hypothetical protein, conserved [Eimeria maxima]
MKNAIYAESSSPSSLSKLRGLTSAQTDIRCSLLCFALKVEFRRLLISYLRENRKCVNYFLDTTESESGVLRELELGCILWCLNIHTSAGLEVERAEAEARQDFAKTNENLLRRKLQFVFQEINSAYQLKFTLQRLNVLQELCRLESRFRAIEGELPAGSSSISSSSSNTEACRKEIPINRRQFDMLQDARNEFEIGCWNKLKQTNWYASLEALLPSSASSSSHLQDPKQMDWALTAAAGGAAADAAAAGASAATATAAPALPRLPGSCNDGIPEAPRTDQQGAPVAGPDAPAQVSRHLFKLWGCCTNPKSNSMQEAADGTMDLPSFPSPERTPAAPAAQAPAPEEAIADEATVPEIEAAVEPAAAGDAATARGCLGSWTLKQEEPKPLVRSERGKALRKQGNTGKNCCSSSCCITSTCSSSSTGNGGSNVSPHTSNAATADRRNDGDRKEQETDIEKEAICNSNRSNSNSNSSNINRNSSNSNSSSSNSGVTAAPRGRYVVNGRGRLTANRQQVLQRQCKVEKERGREEQEKHTARLQTQSSRSSSSSRKLAALHCAQLRAATAPEETAAEAPAESVGWKQQATSAGSKEAQAPRHANVSAGLQQSDNSAKQPQRLPTPLSLREPHAAATQPAAAHGASTPSSFQSTLQTTPRNRQHLQQLREEEEERQQQQRIASPPPLTLPKPPLHPPELHHRLSPGQQHQQRQQPQKPLQPQQPQHLQVTPRPWPVHNEGLSAPVDLRGNAPLIFMTDMQQHKQHQPLVFAASDIQHHTCPTIARVLLPSPRTPLLVLPQSTAVPQQVQQQQRLQQEQLQQQLHLHQQHQLGKQQQLLQQQQQQLQQHQQLQQSHQDHLHQHQQQQLHTTMTPQQQADASTQQHHLFHTTHSLHLQKQSHKQQQQQSMPDKLMKERQHGLVDATPGANWQWNWPPEAHTQQQQELQLHQEQQQEQELQKHESQRHQQNQDLQQGLQHEVQQQQQLQQQQRQQQQEQHQQLQHQLPEHHQQQQLQHQPVQQQQLQQQQLQPQQLQPQQLQQQHNRNLMEEVPPQPLSLAWQQKQDLQQQKQELNPHQGPQQQRERQNLQLPQQQEVHQLHQQQQHMLQHQDMLRKQHELQQPKPEPHKPPALQQHVQQQMEGSIRAHYTEGLECEAVTQQCMPAQARPHNTGYGLSKPPNGFTAARAAAAATAAAIAAATAAIKGGPQTVGLYAGQQTHTTNGQGTAVEQQQQRPLLQQQPEVPTPGSPEEIPQETDTNGLSQQQQQHLLLQQEQQNVPQLTSALQQRGAPRTGAAARVGVAASTASPFLAASEMENRRAAFPAAAAAASPTGAAATASPCAQVHLQPRLAPVWMPHQLALHQQQQQQQQLLLPTVRLTTLPPQLSGPLLVSPGGPDAHPQLLLQVMGNSSGWGVRTPQHPSHCV